MEHIRKAVSADVSRIAEILVFTKRMNYRRIFHNDKMSFGELQVYPLAQEYMNDPEKLESIWVYDDEFVKGMMRIEGREIQELYVDSFFQNEGIGSKLTRFACQQKDCREVWVLEKNERAVAFYLRHGFRLTGEREAEAGTPEYILHMSR